MATADTSPRANEPTLQERILNMYSEGASDAEVAASLDLPEKRFMELYDENPALQKIINIGRTKSKAWWYAVGRRNLLSKGWQGATWSMNMKNRFNWADKVDTGERSDTSHYNVDDLQTELHNTMRRIEQMSPAAARKIMTGDGNGTE